MSGGVVTGQYPHHNQHGSRSGGVVAPSFWRLLLALPVSGGVVTGQYPCRNQHGSRSGGVVAPSLSEWPLTGVDCILWCLCVVVQGTSSLQPEPCSGDGRCVSIDPYKCTVPDSSNGRCISIDPNEHTVPIGHHLYNLMPWSGDGRCISIDPDECTVPGSGDGRCISIDPDERTVPCSGDGRSG